MTVPLIINGSTFSYPQTGDTNWGVQATGWASAVTVGMLQRAGGSFTLTAEVDFGATYGLMAAYYKSKGTNISLTGVTRLARTESLGWRNQANSMDLLLGVNSSDVMTFNGEVVPAGLIVNADVDPAAAIAFSKMAALTVSRALVSDGSGVVSVSAATSAQVGYLSTVTSDVQVQIDAKVAKAGDTMTGALVLYGDPATGLEAATKQYVDSLAAGLNAKTACRVATVSSGTLASSFENGDTVDGVVLATGNRILIKDQAAPAENGIYTVNASGAPTRATDADTWSELVGAYTFISLGTANAATSWVCNVAAGGTINTTPVTFVQFSAAQAYTADNQGVLLTGSVFSLQLDGTTLSQSASGAKVNEIANAQIAAAAAIAVNKLAALTASRAVVTDGSGFAAAATTTATEIGYVNGVTSAIQTQLDAKIAASVLTTNGDLLTRAAGVPARIAIGTSGYYLGSSGTAAAWTAFNYSYSYMLESTAPTLTIPTTWTTLTLNAFDFSTGTAWGRSGNDLSAPFTGKFIAILSLGGVDTATVRNMAARVRNTTDVTNASISCDVPIGTDGSMPVFRMPFSAATGKVYQVQICATGSGLVANRVSIDSSTTNLWKLELIAVPQ